MTQTAQDHGTCTDTVLFLAIDLGLKGWRVASSPGGGAPRVRSLAGGDVAGLFAEIDSARIRFGLSSTCRVMICHEAGRDGFWLHRALTKRGWESLIVDAGSIESNRRARRRKTDRLDAQALVRKLISYERGDRRVWSVLRVPSEEVEDTRRLHRELERLKKDRQRLRNRAWSDLALVGVRPARLIPALRKVERLHQWDGKPLPRQLLWGLQMLRERLDLLESQIDGLEEERKRRLKEPQTRVEKRGRQLCLMRSIGVVSAWKLSSEFFWREFSNRRQVARAAGLDGSPSNSGETEQEQGISKVGNRRVRTLMVEIAWDWLRWQPGSHLARWFTERFAGGGKRMRKIGIVALARRLLIALWRFLEFGEVPEGAVLKPVAS